MSDSTTADDIEEFEPHPGWKWHERGGWEDVARMRVAGYFASVEDQDGDSSVWCVSKDGHKIASGQFYDMEPIYHQDLALDAAEEALRELGVI